MPAPEMGVLQIIEGGGPRGWAAPPDCDIPLFDPEVTAAGKPWTTSSWREQLPGQSLRDVMELAVALANVAKAADDGEVAQILDPDRDLEMIPPGYPGVPCRKGRFFGGHAAIPLLGTK